MHSLPINSSPTSFSMSNPYNGWSLSDPEAMLTMNLCNEITNSLNLWVSLCCEQHNAQRVATCDFGQFQRCTRVEHRTSLAKYCNYPNLAMRSVQPVTLAGGGLNYITYFLALISDKEIHAILCLPANLLKEITLSRARPYSWIGLLRNEGRFAW